MIAPLATREMAVVSTAKCGHVSRLSLCHEIERQREAKVDTCMLKDDPLQVPEDARRQLWCSSYYGYPTYEQFRVQ